MKKILYRITVISMAFILGFSSCADELDRLWNNPNTHNPAPDEVVSGLFTQLQMRRFWISDYGEWWHNLAIRSWLEIAQITTQTVHNPEMAERFANTHYGDLYRFYAQSNNVASNRFSWFYTDLRSYGLIRDEVDVLSGEELTDNIIYYRLANVLKNEVALQTVDLFNSIPFFNAFKGTQGVFFPEYDDPTEIYKTVIADFRATAAELPAIHAAMSPLARNIFAKQDYFFGGDISKWVQYINAQMLKSSVRISGVEEAFAKEHIAVAIQNLPQEDFTIVNPFNQGEVRVLAGAGGGSIQRAWAERQLNLNVPDVIMTRMNHGADIYEADIDDPRLPVITLGFVPADKVDNLVTINDGVEFFGTSMDWINNTYWRMAQPDREFFKRNVWPQPPAAPQNWTTFQNFSLNIVVQATPWTAYNPITFALNQEIVTLFTRAEVDLLLAEVALKGFATTGKTPGQHINDAVLNSTEFWYWLNQRPNNVTPAQWTDLARAVLMPAKPPTGVIQNYANFVQGLLESAGGVDDQLEIIMQQKYIHLNVMDPYELFAELRRTRRPKLEPVTSVGSDRTITNETMMLERFLLPSSERDSNADNYAVVAPYDRLDVPIFWVPENRRNETYFLPRAIKDPIRP